MKMQDVFSSLCCQTKFSTISPRPENVFQDETSKISPNAIFSVHIYEVSRHRADGGPRSYKTKELGPIIAFRYNR